ncbi:hypothetical protein M409DRAFT_29718 [Zasmidium cellare ATCC 36951]|uniref:Metallo-beta-lactamase domain-containing protein n=1 Tax=Zasmidium cellare ATCC 36951 TaxID=1080233 RepID=A0A6A6C0V9_ZASCE|nr:uncharacterized protein M409DRAFT_29718 [Zasmidium cellare ATCC 36951]KAF2159908.1 hypothetical protein M409DRAFT_29718 [Zasmidium cellare ATCC 36951]
MAALPPPGLHIPASTSTVSISIIKTSTEIRGLPTGYFFDPPIPGHDHIAAPAFAFLIRHPVLNRTLIFDLGMSKNWRSNPVLNARFGNSKDVGVTVNKSVREILESEGLDCKDVEAVVWSHWHMDHTGDVPEIEKSTKLIVGPGFQEKVLPGYPRNPESYVMESDWEGRELLEIDFSTSGLKIGKFQAYDYFGDGSFYFLDSPGHAVGHLCGLARVTADPPSFILMGGDAYHHGGMIRPSPYLPFPENVAPNPFAPSTGSPCLGHIFESLLQDGDKKKPFYKPSAPAAGGAYDDPEEAGRTIQKLQEADVREDILMVAAHDETLLDIVDFFPKLADGFVEKGWVRQARWRFLKDFAKAVGYEGEVEGMRSWGPPNQS